MDNSTFHSNYDAFPAPLLLQSTDGSWFTNPAAEALCFSQTDLEQLAMWDGSASLWLGGRFFYVQGHRTEEGLFLILHPDAFMSSAAANLSNQLRQRVSLAFTGAASLSRHLNKGNGDVKEDLSVVDRALFQIFRIVTELENCIATELPHTPAYLDLLDWFHRLTDELKQLCAPIDGITFHIDFPDAPMATMADSQLLDILVSHLISNAIKAAPEGEADISLSLKKQGDQAILTVRGNGAAFSPAVLTDPVWNQPISLQPGRGLGLGLPIAQRIAALHSGTLMVTPTKSGSQVVVSLPLSVPEGYLASSAPPQDDTGGFSMVRVILSDALPSAAFHPDHFPERKEP